MLVNIVLHISCVFSPGQDDEDEEDEEGALEEGEEEEEEEEEEEHAPHPDCDSTILFTNRPTGGVCV